MIGLLGVVTRDELHGLYDYMISSNDELYLFLVFDVNVLLLGLPDSRILMNPIISYLQNPIPTM